MTDWSKTKFRASSWGNLMTEPREKAAKDKGELSKTCQKELVKIYNLVKYGRKRDIVTKEMLKGTMVEPESITLFSRVEKKLFVKNEEKLENEWFTGHPDIFEGENIRTANEVHDIKSPWDMQTFTPLLIDGPDDGYELQLQVYFDLTGASLGSVVSCLVSTPEELIMGELRGLLYNMNVISEESPEYKAKAAELRKNMVFEDVDYRERVIKHVVHRDNEMIQRMKDKVPKLRSWLAWFEDLHMNGRKPAVPVINPADIVLTKIKK